MAEPVIASSQSLILDLPPSCVEFCQASPSYFVVGTYNLQKDDPVHDAENDGSDQGEHAQEAVAQKPQSRNGTLMVFRMLSGQFEQVQVVPQPSAILDLHFSPVAGRENILAVVSSTGTLALFKLDPALDASSPLQHLSTSTLPELDDGVLFLSVAWHPKRPEILATTLSNGEVRLLRVNDSWNIADSTTVITHSLEAWTVVFSAQEPSLEGFDDSGAIDMTIYSGGDDSALRYASLTSSSDGEDEVSLQAMYPPLKLNGHEAGVTAILPTTCRLSDGSDLVVTGSYDDNLRVFAIQAPASSYGARKTRLLAEKNLGGGVWRLKMVRVHDEAPARWSAVILVSCMHAGSRVVRVTGSRDASLEWDVQVVARFEEHKSMNYGSDFLPETSTDSNGLACVSTSFYDKLMCLWTAARNDR